MDPITTAIITGLVSNSKVLAEMVVTITDKGKKSQLEAMMAQIDLAKAQLESVAGKCDDLAAKCKELQAENQALSDKVAHFELSIEFDIKDGLLYKKGSGEGPYCQVDRYQMTFQGHSVGNKIMKCPKCGHEAQTPDPELAGDYMGGVAVLKVGPNPLGNWRG